MVVEVAHPACSNVRWDGTKKYIWKCKIIIKMKIKYNNNNKNKNNGILKLNKIGKIEFKKK